MNLCRELKVRYSKQMNMFYSGDEEKLGLNIVNGINAKMNVNAKIYAKEA